MGNQEALEVARMLGADPLDELLRLYSLFLGFEHGGRAVGIVRADVDHQMAAHPLKAHPDVCLDVLQQVTDVNGAVCVGQGAGDQDATCHEGLRVCGSGCPKKAGL